MMPEKHICKVCGRDKPIEFHWVAHSPDTFTPMCKYHHKVEHKRDPTLDVNFPDWKKTTISLNTGTKVRIMLKGKFGQNWEELLNYLMDEFDDYQEVKKSWQGRVYQR